MSEREHRNASTKEAQRSTTLIRLIPHPLTVHIADKILGEGLSQKGHKKLKYLIQRVLRREQIQVSREVPQIYKDHPFEFYCEGQGNIPRSQATLFIGNHTEGGPLSGMAQYSETSRVVYEERTDVCDERLREPVAIAQRGLTKVVRLLGGRKFIWTIPFTGQFYDMAAAAFNWIVVDPPRFDSNGQIVNKQRLPRQVTENLIAGGALLWFPQGKHENANYLTMPQKSSGLLTRLKDEDVRLVAMRFVPGKNSLSMFFSDAVHIQDLVQKEGRVDMDDFVSRYLKPLGPK